MQPYDGNGLGTFVSVPIDGYPEAEAFVYQKRDKLCLCCDSCSGIEGGLIRWLYEDGAWVNKPDSKVPLFNFVLPEPHVAATLMLLFPEVFQ